MLRTCPGIDYCVGRVTLPSRVHAFKRRRYDRLGGSLLWAKDKLFGMDELPEVEEIFDSEKSRFVTAMDALLASAARR